MKTYLFEACQNKEIPRNWGKFMVGIPDSEWRWRSEVDIRPAVPLLRRVGWSPGFIWVCDLQTGEGAFFRLGGSASADLNRQHIWVCPLFEPWLEWLYKQDISKIGELPQVVELPDAKFAFHGYRRSGR